MLFDGHGHSWEVLGMLLGVLFWKILVRFHLKATGSITCLAVHGGMYFSEAAGGGRELLAIFSD